MNNDFSSLKTALKDGTDCSSTATFNGVCHCVEKTQPSAFILENVDSMDTSSGEEDDREQTKSNLQMALNYLEGLGYTCCAEKLKTSDYGVPQRRTRYYIFGISNKDKFAVSAKEIIKLIPARLTACMSVNSPIDHFLLKDDDRVVLAELNRRLNAGDRRAQRKASSEPGPSSSGDKWREQHSNLAEQLGVKWPLTPSTQLTQSRWFE
ncbi:unnamed protein product [Cladocopium goreaui]|uniref:Type II methyltransferase M.NgoBI (M.NgoBI) (Cytosine-specific methyltransferase NgoBI) (M.NgoI) (Modification methylase NgoBI) n=1 Tax=Cladocopium goreaui TaxID=2562237 RepID=A0A9P1CHG3_9DINO|nr:unnamed protein product [Cladocopium goreaui]